MFFAQLSRHISEISEFESKQAALDVINAAISRELEKLPQSSYIKISETDGRITSINSDTNAVNRLQSSVSRAVNESLSQLEGTKLSVPIGTLSGINILTGRGFDIPLRLHQIGAAKTELKKRFNGSRDKSDKIQPLFHCDHRNDSHSSCTLYGYRGEL